MIEGRIDGRSLRASKLREQRRSEIVRAAERVIGEKGFHATSIDDVIAASGVSRGTFYTYFESRDILFENILDGFISKLRGVIRPVRLEDPSGHLENLYLNLVAVLRLLLEHRDLSLILLREALSHGGQVQYKLQLLDIFLQRMIGGALRNGAALGLTRKVNEELVTIAILGSLKELTYYHLQAPQAKRDPEVLAQELLTFFFKGLSHGSVASLP